MTVVPTRDPRRDLHESAGTVTWELRWHPFRAQWVLFTAHRGARPWIGEVVARDEVEVPHARSQAPAGSHPYYPFHVEFHPPLRAPGLMKYLAGPEIGGGSMTNESDPDAKAADLRSALA